MLFVSLCAVAAEQPGYKAETGKDTRPVKIEATAADPHAGVPRAKGASDDTGPSEIAFPEMAGKLDFRDLEMLCIQEGGRKKPLHTYASEQMEQLIGRPLSPVQLSGWFAARPYVKDKISGRKVEALDLFFALWFQSTEWVRAPIVLISYGPLKKELGLPEKEKHFSPQRLARLDRLMQLWEGTRTKRKAGLEKDLTDIEKEAEIVEQRLQLLASVMSSDETLSLVPHPSEPLGTWLTLEKFHGSYSPKTPEDAETKPYYPVEKAQPLFVKLAAVREAYIKRDAVAFSTATNNFRAALIELSPTIYPANSTLQREVNYNDLRPFGKAWVFYLFATLIGAFAIKSTSKALYTVMMVFFFGGLALHIWGFALRCFIAGRPPVSNMYESVIWVGFGSVLFGLIFEIIYKKRYFAVSGAGAGFMCLVLMDLLPAVVGNSKMPGFSAEISPLVPVLRDNFWLTVHVLTITLSYAAFMLAWVLGHITLGKHLFVPAAKAEQRELHQFVYRAVQVGVLLLAVGTILGGVWAYYSWGRFWGWDPKETWAFISLMCYLFVLHGRFAGWWGNFGLSVGSVVCFQAIVMAWYGVNFVLGKGLHSYGTGSGGEEYVLGFVAFDAIFTGAAIWRYSTYKDKSNSTPGEQSELADGALTTGDPITDVRKEFGKPAAGE